MHEIDLFPDQIVLDLVQKKLRVLDTHLEQSITAARSNGRWRARRR